MKKRNLFRNKIDNIVTVDDENVVSFLKIVEDLRTLHFLRVKTVSRIIVSEE